MEILFILPADYTPREMQLVLSRHGKGWKFYGYANGYSVPARNSRGELLCKGETFATKQEAGIMARALGLPAYAVWNGRKRCYTGHGAKLRAFPCNAMGAEIQAGMQS